MSQQLLANRYLILETLSSGGFGKTYKALDQHMPQPLVCVIKQLAPPSSDPRTMEICRKLFEKEARTLQDLGEHPKIPRLLAYFEQDQQFYLSQEYIEGKPLSQEFSEKQQYTEIEVIELLKDVLETLSFVHQKKVIHRDIKPANLMRRFSDQKLVLIDFGAVKQATTQIIDTQEKSPQSIVIGTPGYMSSEQSQGYPTYASDIFALGVVGIQALMGKSPEVIERDVHGELIWLSDPDLKISSRLANIITKMVRFSPRERYDSTQAVLYDLQQPQKPSPDETDTLKIKSQKKPRLLTGLGIGSLIAIVGFGVYHFTNISQTSPTEFAVYQNKTLGIQLNYPTLPSLWTVNENFLSNEISFQNPHTLDQVDISIEPLAQDYSLDKYTIDQTQIIRSNNVSNDVSVTKTQLGNYDARQINYSAEDNGTVLEVRHSIIVIDGKAYNIISRVEENNNSSANQVVKEMMDSFKIIPDSP